MKLFISILFLSILLNARMPGNAGAGSIINENLKYNFTYRFQMDMKGRILLIIPYRFYHEVSASVNFIARKDRGNRYEFCFDGIGGTGYVMTTGGLRGTSLYFFTADYSLEKAADFREKKIQEFKKKEPYYSENIKKIRRRPMKILSDTDDAVRFDRDSRGIHSNSLVNIQLTDSHSFTYSNIYKILGKMLNLYNHSFLPGNTPENKQENKQGNKQKVKADRLEQLIDYTWYSKSLDFSKALGEAAGLTSEYAEKNTGFKQEQKFRMEYRITAVDKNYIEICGESYPDVTIGKKMKITQVLRKIRIQKDNDVMTEDMILLDFRNSKGRGGTVFAKLKLIDK